MLSADAGHLEILKCQLEGGASIDIEDNVSTNIVRAVCRNLKLCMASEWWHGPYTSISSWAWKHSSVPCAAWCWHRSYRQGTSIDCFINYFSIWLHTNRLVRLPFLWLHRMLSEIYYNPKRYSMPSIILSNLYMIKLIMLICAAEIQKAPAVLVISCISQAFAHSRYFSPAY